jgi:hypothetical protein
MVNFPDDSAPAATTQTKHATRELRMEGIMPYPTTSIYFYEAVVFDFGA